jgi:hypothetical protein
VADITVKINENITLGLTVSKDCTRTGIPLTAFLGDRPFARSFEDDDIEKLILECESRARHVRGLLAQEEIKVTEDLTQKALELVSSSDSEADAFNKLLQMFASIK